MVINLQEMLPALAKEKTGALFFYFGKCNYPSEAVMFMTWIEVG